VQKKIGAEKQEDNWISVKKTWFEMPDASTKNQYIWWLCRSVKVEKFWR